MAYDAACCCDLQTTGTTFHKLSDRINNRHDQLIQCNGHILRGVHVHE